MKQKTTFDTTKLEKEEYFDETDRYLSEQDLADDGFTLYETVLATDRSGIWYFRVPKFKNGKEVGEVWLPARTN